MAGMSALPMVIRTPMKVCCAPQVVKTQTFLSPAKMTDIGEKLRPGRSQ